MTLAERGTARHMLRTARYALQNGPSPVPDDLAVSREMPSDPQPYFRAHVFACTNRRPDGHRRGSCAARGAEALRDYMKARAKEMGLPSVRVNSAGCLDRCEFGPTLVIYPEGVWYRAETREDVDEILTVHLRDGGRVRRLMLTEEHVLPGKG